MKIYILTAIILAALHWCGCYLDARDPRGQK